MLFREANGDLVVSVVCGTVGLYEVEAVLTSEQRRSYEEEGIEVVVRLAADVAEHAGKYRG